MPECPWYKYSISQYEYYEELTDYIINYIHEETYKELTDY